MYHISSEPELYDCMRYLPEMDDYFATTYYMLDNQMLNLPSSEKNTLNYDWLKDTQDTDPSLEGKCTNKVPGYSKQKFDEVELICFTAPGKDTTNDWKICLTDEAVGPAVAWFHQVLGHPGRQRLYQGMNQYYHPKLRTSIDSYQCNACQRYKVDGRGFGHLAPRDVQMAPLE